MSRVQRTIHPGRGWRRYSLSGRRASFPSRTTEAEIAIPGLRIDPVALGSAHLGGVVTGPAGATSDAARACGRTLRIRLRTRRVGSIPITCPLPYVPTHVEHSERTGAIGKAPY